MTRRPLDGIRVLEMGQLLAGPFAGTLLAYFGAEVVKIEPPGSGDPIRGWRELDRDAAAGDTSLWWYTLGRNKKCVTLDLRRERGRQLARRLALRADVLIENFRPGTLERWGLDPASLHPEHPALIYARVSGYGQSGPKAGQPGYASVAEAFGGLRHLTGMPDGPPVRSNLSLGDSLSGLHAAFGVLLALLDRVRQGEAGGAPVVEGAGGEPPVRRGQIVDVALFESVFNMLEAVVPEYDRNGVVRGPSGTTISGVVPSNTFRCRCGRFVVIGANGLSNYRRLMNAAGRPDLADDPRLATNAGRVEHQQEIDDALATWAATLDASDLLATLAEAAVPAGPIYSVADMMGDEHYRARGLFEQVEAGGRPLALPAILPKLSGTPGRTDWPGPPLGAHNAEVLGGWLGLSEAELAELERDGVV